MSELFGHELRENRRRCFTKFLELDHTSRLDQLELVVILEVVLAASLSRFTPVQPGLDCKVVQTGFNLKLAHYQDSNLSTYCRV